MIKVTIIASAPRTGKTTIAKQIIEKNKDKEIIAVTYNQHMATHNFSEYSNVTAIGIQTGICGRSCNLLVIDDLIKDRRQARSQDELSCIWNNFINLFARVVCAPNAEIFIIGSKWIEFDFMHMVIDFFKNAINTDLTIYDLQPRMISEMYDNGDL